MIVSTEAQLRNANANAPAGDLIQLAPRPWSTPIAPARPGITYAAQGSSIPGLTINRDRTVVIGAVIRGSLTVEDCRGISVRDCHVVGGDLLANQMLWLIRRVDRAHFYRIRSFGRLGAVWDCRGRCFYETTNSVIEECETVLEYTAAENGAQHVQFMRDRSYDNQFIGDVVRAGHASPHAWRRQLMLGTSGSYPGTSPRNRFVECDYDVTGRIFLQDIATDWSLERSRFVSGDEIRTNRVDRLLAGGCTFQAPGAHAFIEDGGRLSTGELRDCRFVSAADPGYGIGSAGLRVVNATSERPPIDQEAA